VTAGLALLRFEVAAARRGRTVLLFAVGFAAVSVGIALVGLSAGGAVAVQGFARTSVSLLQVVTWVVPLLGLLLGGVAGADLHELEFVVALPISRRRLLGARWAAWFTAIGAAVLLGLGAAGIAIGSLAGAADALRYLALLLISELLLGATLALGMVVGVLAGNRARAVGLAVVVWFVLVVGVDLLAIGALALLPPRDAGWGLSLLLLADPVDSARALGLGLFRADAVAGPTGAALHRVLGGWGAWALAAGLVGWTAGPLWLAGRRFARRDL
jgi:Cu-processing system permease protein